MTQHPLSQSRAAHISKNLDCQLLHDVQVCLRKRQSKLAPSNEEEQTLQRFYDLYNPLLECFVAACGIKGEDAKDCLQEAWTAITQGLLGFISDGTEDKLGSWLYGIVHNKAADICRDRIRHRTKPLDGQTQAALASQDAGPDARYEQRCVEEEVRQVLEVLRAKLPGSTYLAFHLYWIEKKRITEIAAELSLERRGVIWRLCKAKRRFRRLYEQMHKWRGRSSDAYLKSFSENSFRCSSDFFLKTAVTFWRLERLLG